MSENTINEPYLRPANVEQEIDVQSCVFLGSMLLYDLIRDFDEKFVLIAMFVDARPQIIQSAGIVLPFTFLLMAVPK